MKKRILFATNYLGNDTTSWLRAWGPFTLMRNEVEIVEPIVPTEKTGLKYGWWSNWRNWYNNIDVCFMHRPFGPVAAHIMSQCKMHGIPLWVDHDDDLLNIPDKNPYAKIHNDGEKEFPAVEMSYKYADILTCSGEVMHYDLKTKYKRPDAILITSGMDDRLLKFKKPFNANNKISWRGSESHKSDLEDFQIYITRLVRDEKNREFYFWGIDPEKLWNEFKDYPNWKFEVQLNLIDYIHSITKVNASIHMVPLEENRFNKVKSNLAWLDTTLAGSVVLGPDFPEWNRPGIIRYKGKADFYDKMKYLISHSKDFLEFNHNESWAYIKDCLLTSHLNKQRREILKNL